MATKSETNKTPSAVETAFIMDKEGLAPVGIRMTFGNGKVEEFRDGEFAPHMVSWLTWHGAKQKFGDGAAIARNQETGRAATFEDKYEAVMEIAERVRRGEWFKAREGGAGNVGGLLLKALCRLYPAKTPDDLRAYLAGKSDAEKTALRANPRVAAVIAEIREETGKAASVDTDAMLDELS